MKLSVVQTIQRQIMDILTNNDVKGMWKEAVAA